MPGVGYDDDGGFTMIEMIVAILLIGIVMTALTTFFVTTVSATTRQGSAQAAAQLADDAVETARSLKGSAVAAGRDKTSSDVQWNSVVAGVLPYQADMVETWDPGAAVNAGQTASLPTIPTLQTINNLVYNQNWYVGTCWQPTAGLACGTTNTAGLVALYRVVVAVTWSDKACAGSKCSYVTSTLISGASSEPVFPANGVAQPPTVTNPGAQTADKGAAASLLMVATGGAPSIVWVAANLPPGLTISAATGLVTGTPTTSNAYSVIVTATDGFSLVGSAAFSWTINPPPVLSGSSQTTMAGATVSLSPTLTGGTGPFAWTTTPLPAGLTINATSGVIAGSPTTAATTSVTVTVVDVYRLTSSTTFSWVVAPPLTITTPTAQAGDAGLAIVLPVLQVVATGGVGPYTWTATGLPTGLAIASSTGIISGTPTSVHSYSVVVTVTDSASNHVATSPFSWTIAPALNITHPSMLSRTSPRGTALTLVGTVTGGNGPFTWTATGLPAGLSINSTGTIAGTPTNTNSNDTTLHYTVAVTATDALGQSDTFTFSWNVS